MSISPHITPGMVNSCAAILFVVRHLFTPAVSSPPQYFGPPALPYTQKGSKEETNPNNLAPPKNRSIPTPNESCIMSLLLQALKRLLFNPLLKIKSCNSWVVWFSDLRPILIIILALVHPDCSIMLIHSEIYIERGYLRKFSVHQ
jgi:hypothetical protein